MYLFKAQIYSLLFFLLLDVLLNCISPSIYTPWFVNSILQALQIVSVVIVAILFYSLASRTITFRAGLFLGIFSRVKWYMLASIVHLLFICGHLVVRLLAGLNNKEQNIWWDWWWYWFIWISQQTIAILYYVTVMFAVGRFSDSTLYVSRKT